MLTVFKNKKNPLLDMMDASSAGSISILGDFWIKTRGRSLAVITSSLGILGESWSKSRVGAITRVLNSENKWRFFKISFFFSQYSLPFVSSLFHVVVSIRCFSNYSS
jgi:hypothetical protein